MGHVFGASQGSRLTETDTVAPDAAFDSNERWAASAAPVREKLLHVIPNLVVEIVSRTTSKSDLEDKNNLYERGGMDEYWLIDLGEPGITVLAVEAGRYVVADSTQSSGRVHSRLLSGFSVSPDDIIPTE